MSGPGPATCSDAGRPGSPTVCASRPPPGTGCGPARTPATSPPTSPGPRSGPVVTSPSRRNGRPRWSAYASMRPRGVGRRRWDARRAGRRRGLCPGRLAAGHLHHRAQGQGRARGHIGRPALAAAPHRRQGPARPGGDRDPRLRGLLHRDQHPHPRRSRPRARASATWRLGSGAAPTSRTGSGGPKLAAALRKLPSGHPTVSSPTIPHKPPDELNTVTTQALLADPGQINARI